MATKLAQGRGAVKNELARADHPTRAGKWAHAVRPYTERYAAFRVR